jgi:hypothetical protein
MPDEQPQQTSPTNFIKKVEFLRPLTVKSVAVYDLSVGDQTGCEKIVVGNWGVDILFAPTDTFSIFVPFSNIASLRLEGLTQHKPPPPPEAPRVLPVQGLPSNMDLKKGPRNVRKA